MTNYVQYEMRDLLQVVEYNSQVDMFLRNMIMGGQAGETHATTTIEVDVVRGGQRVAAYVSRRADPERVQKDGYNTYIHVMPYTYQEMVITPEDVETRTPGTTIYASGSPSSRLDYLMGRWMRQLDDRVARLEELQIAQVLTSGIQTISGNGVDYTVNYQRTAGNEVTLLAGDRWSEASTRDIRGDFRAAAEQMRKPGVDGGDPTIVIMGSNAANNYIADQAVQGGLLDLKAVEAGRINIQYLAGQRATFIGTHRDAGITVDVYSYHGQYVNSSGVATPYINTNDAIFIRQGLMAAPHYSMISNFESGSFVGRRYPRQRIANDGKTMILTLESGPLMTVNEIDATYSLHTNG